MKRVYAKIVPGPLYYAGMSSALCPTDGPAIFVSRLPRDTGAATGLLRAVWCSISALSLAPTRTTIVDTHIQVIEPMMAPSEGFEFLALTRAHARVTSSKTGSIDHRCGGIIRAVSGLLAAASRPDRSQSGSLPEHALSPGSSCPELLQSPRPIIRSADRYGRSEGWQNDADRESRTNAQSG